MRKKSILIGLIIISFLLLACERNDARVVKAVPSGFISLNEAIENANGTLRYVLWESQISFLDADNITIFQTGFENSNFIVRSQEEYFINEEKYLEMFSKANLTMEQRNRIYNLKEKVELRKSAIGYFTVTLEKVEVDIIDTVKIYTFRFSVENIDYDDQKNQIFDLFVTESGREIKDYTFLDESTVQVKLQAGEKLKLIVLKSPVYENSVRRVSITN